MQNWNGELKALIEFLLPVVVKLSLSPIDFQHFSLYMAVLFDLLWKERNRALYTSEKTTISNFMKSISELYEDYLNPTDSVD